MNRLNLVCLGVRDMRTALAFYRSIGFETYETGDNPPIVFFNNQGSRLELYPLDQLARDIDADHPPPVSPGFGGITLACNMTSKNDVDRMMHRVADCGGVVVKPPRDVAWGGYSGYFRDPDGYYWEVAYAACWRFDENDMLIIDPPG